MRVPRRGGGPTPQSSPGRSRSESPEPLQLPNELVIEIFRNRVLSRHDLFNCALVSRRFRDPVNEILYSHLEIDIHMLDDGQQEGEDTVWAWSARGWELLRTRVECPDFTQHIRSLYFDIEWGGYKSDARKRTVTPFTTPAIAFSTIVRAARKLEKITRLTLEDADLESTGYDFLAKFKPELTHLKCRCLHPGQIERDHLKKLEVLDFVFGPSWGRLDMKLDCVLASTSTLRILRTDIDVAIHLDYSLFPRLVELDLIGAVEEADPDAFFGELATQCSKFWQSLSKSPSLHTLSLSFTYGYAYDRVLYRLPEIRESLRGPVSTLQTLRFNNDTHLDLLNLDLMNIILSSKYFETVRAVVLPWLFREETATEEQRNQVRFVAIASKGREVVFATEEGRED
ncbi:F-box protein [Sporobolomyces salmoneus]|uniref:F-box protein n=1 Tax=Sporobolomyces salmoneus TaxID=183962 RepID=UPI00316F68C7